MKTIAQKKAKASLIIWGTTYGILFPVLFLELEMVLADLLLTVSFPISILLMFFCYKKGYYKLTRFCWLAIFPMFLLILIFFD